MTIAGYDRHLKELGRRSASGTKQTSGSTLKMSAFGGKQTSLIGWPMSANDP